jgi:hypothetical protein
MIPDSLCQLRICPGAPEFPKIIARCNISRNELVGLETGHPLRRDDKLAVPAVESKNNAPR